MVTPDKQTLKDLYFLTFKCQAQECPFQGSYLQSLNHLTACNSSFHNCPQNCGLAILGKDIEYHCIAQCEKAKIWCKTCDFNYYPN